MRGRLALWIVAVAARALPAGEIRRRYHQEFVAELHQLSGSRQVRYALAVLCTAPALRRAVGRDGLVPATVVPARPARPMMCRLNLHHHWRRYSTEDGGNRYWACDRCGKDRLTSEGGGPPPISFG